MKKILFLIIIFIINADSFGQENISFTQTGNLSFDAKQVLESYTESNLPQIVLENDNKKSPFLAGILSLLVPGAGEIYSEEYLKAGIFIALEAAVITTAVIYDGKGDDKTTEFQNYADAYDDPNNNWSVVRYAQWLVQYEHNNDQDLLNRIIISSDESLPPWQRVNWAELNAAEKGSHKLPRHGEQQYYELIGKYHQYSSGWNDFTGGANKDQISPNFIFYSGMRGEANDFYSVASTAVIGIYVNHFLRALDAVWSASQFNSDLAVKVRLDNIQLTDRAVFYPKVIFTYSF